MTGTIIITGGASGIGLATAELARDKGRSSTATGCGITSKG